MPGECQGKEGAGWRMICAQEKAIIADVDAIRVSRKPEVIGTLFEDGFRQFLSRIAPSGISIVPGFIVEKDGEASSHFDALVVDSAYPFLSSIGPHRYVMAPAVVAAVELTTSMDMRKLTSVVKKAGEIERISRKLHKDNAWGSIGFCGLAVDSAVPVARLRDVFTARRPSCHIYTLRAPPGSQHAVHCWMEGGKQGFAAVRETKSPLADMISMQFQECLYTLGSRVRDLSTVGEAMNDFIHWGTTFATSP